MVGGGGSEGEGTYRDFSTAVAASFFLVLFFPEACAAGDNEVARSAFAVIAGSTALVVGSVSSEIRLVIKEMSNGWRDGTAWGKGRREGSEDEMKSKRAQMNRQDAPCYRTYCPSTLGRHKLLLPP